METIKLAEKLRGLLRERFPGNYSYVSTLVEILGVHERTVQSKLRGDTQFTLLEAYKIAKKLDIPIGEIFKENDQKFKHSLELYIQDFSNERNNEELAHQTLEAFRLSSSSENCKYFIASNTIPDIVFPDYEWIARFSYLKWLYFSKGYEETSLLSEVKFDQADLSFYSQYRDYIHSSKRTIYILHIDMTQTIVADILFFYKIRLVTREEVESIVNDISKLIDQCEKICNRGVMFPAEREVHFFFSKALLPNDVTILESDELNLAILYTNYHNPVVTTSMRTFHIFRQWFNLWMHSSNIVSASDPEQRYEFFQRQRVQLAILRNNIE